MDSRATRLLAETDRVIREPKRVRGGGPLRVGVDLGTAYVVVTVVDVQGQPVAGAIEFSSVVRDGVVFDYHGAVAVVQRLVRTVQARCDATLRDAATAYPPGIPRMDARATQFVAEAAGLAVVRMVEEPIAANRVIGIQDGMIVDVGGGTTGLAVFKNGEVIYTADEATGGHHFTLVISGALGLAYEEAEELKTDPSEHGRLYPLVVPVIEKVAAIITKHGRGFDVHRIVLVGGAVSFAGFGEVVEAATRCQVEVAPTPHLVTPLGIALSCPIERAAAA